MPATCGACGAAQVRRFAAGVSAASLLIVSRDSASARMLSDEARAAAVAERAVRLGKCLQDEHPDLEKVEYYVPAGEIAGGGESW